MFFFYVVAVKGDLKYMAQAFNLVRKPGSEEAHGWHGNLPAVLVEGGVPDLHMGISGLGLGKWLIYGSNAK